MNEQNAPVPRSAERKTTGFTLAAVIAMLSVLDTPATAAPVPSLGGVAPAAEFQPWTPSESAGVEILPDVACSDLFAQRRATER